MYKALIPNNNKKPALLFLSYQMQRIGATLSILFKVNLLFLTELLGAFAPILGPFIISGYFLEAFGELIVFFKLNNKNLIALLNLIYTLIKAGSIAVAITLFSIWLPLLVPVTVAGLLLFNLGCLYQFKMLGESNQSEEDKFWEKLQETLLAGLLITGFGLMMFFPGPLALAVCYITVGAYLFCIAKACYQRYSAQNTEIHHEKSRIAEKIQPINTHDLSSQLLKKAAQLLVQIEESKGTLRAFIFNEDAKRNAKVLVLIASFIFLNKSQETDVLNTNFNLNELKDRFKLPDKSVDMLQEAIDSTEKQLNKTSVKDFQGFLSCKDYKLAWRRSAYSFFSETAKTTELVQSAEACLLPSLS